jgi:uncharacterized protein YkwD
MWRSARRALVAVAVVALIGASCGCSVASANADARGTSAPARTLGPVAGMAPTPSGHGFWRVTAAGEVLTVGDAHWYGGATKTGLSHPVVGIAATPTGHGYWLVAADGGVFTFGDARFHGSAGTIPLRAPVVGMAASPTGRGYRLVAADGGVFTFGDARFHGSAGTIPLRAPVVGIATTLDGHGYVLAAADGGVFTFGNARFFGSLGDLPLEQPVVGVAGTGRGYVLASADGGAFTFGNARFFGSASSSCPEADAVGIAASSGITGYWITFANARTYAFSHRSRAPQCVVPRSIRVAHDIFERLNTERVARGLAPLRWDAGLARYATDWSRGMASFGFRHSAIATLLTDGRFSWIGENIAWVGAPSTAGRLHSMWMNSPHHRDNIASPTYTAIGIGVFCAPDGKTWATENFGRDAANGPGTPAVPSPPAPFVRQDMGGPSC